MAATPEDESKSGDLLPTGGLVEGVRDDLIDCSVSIY